VEQDTEGIDFISEHFTFSLRLKTLVVVSILCSLY